MNINPIQINTSNSYKSNFKLNNSNRVNSRFASPVRFGYYSETEFVGWQIEKLNILGRGKEGMKVLGEYFHKSDSSLLKEASKIKNFLSITKKEESYRAYNKLLNAVDEVKTYKTKLLKELAELKGKEAQELENIAEQKLRIKSGFIDNVAEESKNENAGMDFNISNGILVYGNSSTQNEAFVNWLKQETPASFYKLKFNHEKPLETLAEIEKLAQDGENSFQVNQKRSIIEVEGMDNFFVDDETREKRMLISAFKRIEHLHQNHATILMRTIKPLENFDEASIGSQRFDFKVPIKRELTPFESDRMAELKKEIEGLDKKAENVLSEFGKYKTTEYKELSDRTHSEEVWDEVMSRS